MAISARRSSSAASSPGRPALSPMQPTANANASRRSALTSTVREPERVILVTTKIATIASTSMTKFVSSDVPVSIWPGSAGLVKNCQQQPGRSRPASRARRRHVPRAELDHGVRTPSTAIPRSPYAPSSAGRAES
jgi:hypothetical protein